LSELDLRRRRELALQRWAGGILAPIWIPAAVFLLRLGFGYRIKDRTKVRRRYRRAEKGIDGGLLLCANHLTMIDSALIAWALGNPLWYLVRYDRMPWNLPERNNFSSNPLTRLAAWIVKCIPVVRGGERGQVSDVLARVRHLLARGETVLVFPEGGRSRSGRVQPHEVTYGVGRILTAVPECRVGCIYLRGDRQESWSTLPRRGEAFTLTFELFRPRSSRRGLRRARELSRRIGEKLAEMEERYFAERGSHVDGVGEETVDGMSVAEGDRSVADAG